MSKYLQFFFSLFVSAAIYTQAIETGDVVSDVFARYQRPFTFLGIGEDMGRFVAQWAPLYPESVFVILEENLEDPETLSSEENVIWLNHRLLLKEAQDLASCEHVDVLLLSDALPRFEMEWKEALQTLQQMAQVVIVHSPKKKPDFSEIDEVIQRDLSQLSNVLVCEKASSFYYVLESKGPFRLIKTTLIHPRKRRWAYEIHSDYNHKHLQKIRPNWTAASPWFPGINLMTFLLFNGEIPSRSQILAHLPLDREHSDWVPNNMIVQGVPILLIDKDDPVSTPVTPDGGKRFRDMETKMRKFISTTPGLSPLQVREAFISIYHWGNYFEQTEIEE